jgi:NDP-sugar pyrophosphorylase family protein/aminoglycoside/choline kinase family phosphotransferase
MNKSLRCFILAAGFGERLRPITNYIPKPLLPILGKPLVELIIERIAKISSQKFKIDKIGMNLHHLKDSIQQWADNSPFKDWLVLFPENPILNTGGALKNAESFLAGGDFIVHNGDIISDIDMEALVEHHFCSNNIATLAVHDFPKFNNVIIDGDKAFKKIAGSHGALDDSEHAVAFTGLAVYSPEFLNFLPSGASSVIDAWLKVSTSGHRIGTFDVTECSWNDIGSPLAYATAIIQALKTDGESAYISPTTLGCDEADLAGNIVIQDSVTLGKGSSLKNSIVLSNVHVGSNTSHSNCIVGPDFTIAIDNSIFETIANQGTLIGTGGSDRHYYRIRKGRGTVVLMQCRHNDHDFSRHMEYSLFFRKYGVPVPEILDSDVQNKSAIFEDLGDLSLYTWLRCPHGDEIREHVYRHIMDILVRLHCEVTEHVSECPKLSGRIFDYAYLRWETDYFLKRFVHGFRKMDSVDITPLADDFHRLALKTDSFPKRIIHRDFQSQNIMLEKGSIPRVIDYQGARMAPPAYDIASILWDPYAPMHDALRERLLAYYMNKVTGEAAQWFNNAEFAESLVCCRLQRHMQALGAYAFLSTEKQKPYFIKHVPEGLRLLKVIAILAKDEYPVLYSLITLL